MDWGRGIDLSLFPSTTQFTGDCRTSGFRCTEMKENKPWKFQASLSFTFIEEFVIELFKINGNVCYIGGHLWTLRNRTYDAAQHIHGDR